MATCPKCLGPLTENHRCPQGKGRRVFRTLTVAVLGGAIGVLFCFVVEDRPGAPLMLAAAALGAVLANAIRRAAGRSA